MNKATKLFLDVRRAASKHSPEILMGIGIAGMITTTILAVKATPKAMKLIEAKKQLMFDELSDEEIPTFATPEDIKLKTGEVIKTAWKPYVPVVISGVFSTACLIGSCSVNNKRNAALATAYKLSEKALIEYRDKVTETIGEKKERDIRDRIAQDHITNDPPVNREVIISGTGETLCYDAISGRYFKSDTNELDKIENRLNYEMINNMYVSLNEFYDAIGLRRTDQGDLLGWNIDNGLVKFDYSYCGADDGTPCIAVGYNIAPRYDYSKLG